MAYNLIITNLAVFWGSSGDLTRLVCFIVTMVLIGVFTSSVQPVKLPIVIANGNGHVGVRAHDAEEFELEGLISDEEEDASKR